MDKLFNDYIKIDSIKKDNLNIIYQGDKGAYTQLAAINYFGNNCLLNNCELLEQVFIKVINNKVDYGIVPFENSTFGSVANVFDYLLKYNCYIVDQYTLAINHCLLGIKGSTKNDIKQIYAHMQSLGQCEKYIEQLNVITNAMSNNAFAANYVYQQNDITKAAIASSYAAKVYNLDILEENINDIKNNFTHFIIISNKKMIIANNNKMSLSFTVDNKAGALLNALEIFRKYNINLTRIESRPIHDCPWAYRFFVDALIGSEDKNIINCLNDLKIIDKNLKILGFYCNN